MFVGFFHFYQHAFSNCDAQTLMPFFSFDIWQSSDNPFGSSLTSNQEPVVSNTDLIGRFMYDSRTHVCADIKILSPYYYVIENIISYSNILFSNFLVHTDQISQYVQHILLSIWLKG